MPKLRTYMGPVTRNGMEYMVIVKAVTKELARGKLRKDLYPLISKSEFDAKWMATSEPDIVAVASERPMMSLAGEEMTFIPMDVDP